MKKTLAATAAFLAIGAHAQSQVTISAVLDAAATTMRTKVNGNSVHLTGLYPSGMSSSLLRFEGREDLGGGSWAGFRLESGLNIDDGTGVATNTNNQRSGATAAGSQSFNRWAYVSLGNVKAGELRLGRVYTAAFESFTPFDPFLTNGIGSSTPILLRLGQRDTQTALNVSNAIDYTTPNYGKRAFARVTLATGENPSSGSLSTSNPRHAGDHAAVRFGWGAEAWTVAFSSGYTRNTAGVTPTGNNQGDYLNTNLALRYDAGWAKLFAEFVTERLKGASAVSGALTGVPSHRAYTHSAMLGTSVPVGLGNVKFSVVDGKLTDNIGSRPQAARLYAVGYDYFFSKRTNVYTVYSHLANNAVGNYAYPAGYLVPGAGQTMNGFALGLRHTF
jgi:predicted porin